MSTVIISGSHTYCFI